MVEDAFLVIDKPEGLTSQQVVARVKRLLGCRKVGHTGTLDPLATGVLPIACNRATRLIQFLDERRKVYSGEIEFGVESDTLDRDGNVVRRHQGPLDLTPAKIKAAFARFTGEMVQIPPLYSAIKSRGRPLYAYARAGIEVELPERRVEIFAFELLDWREPKASFRVTCSKGTYVRSLAADVGRELGCGGRIWSLRREASGPFRLEAALELEEFAGRVAAGAPLPWLEPEAVLGHLPSLRLSDPGLVTMVVHGRSLPFAKLPEPLAGAENGAPLTLFDDGGRLLAIAVPDAFREVLRMARVMAAGG